MHAAQGSAPAQRDAAVNEVRSATVSAASAAAIWMMRGHTHHEQREGPIHQRRRDDDVMGTAAGGHLFAVVEKCNRARVRPNRKPKCGSGQLHLRAALAHSQLRIRTAPGTAGCQHAGAHDTIRARGKHEEAAAGNRCGGDCNDGGLRVRAPLRCGSPREPAVALDADATNVSGSSGRE